jgi:5-methylcytosine-specific restriction protein B
MAELNELIKGDTSLGEQFRVGHSYVTPDPENPPPDPRGWFREVAEAEIKPLLEEYWYDNLSKADDAYQALIGGF